MIFDIVLLFLILFFILLIFIGILNKTIEAFSLGSLPSTPTPSSSSESNGQYKYLAPLPPNNSWSIDIQNAFVTKFNSVFTGLDPSATQITSPAFNGVNFMQNASEKEAKSFIDNGVWPRDVYVTNLITKLQNEASGDVQSTKLVEEFIKTWSIVLPNRLIFKQLIADKLPQNTTLSSLNPNVGTGLVILLAVEPPPSN